MKKDRLSKSENKGKQWTILCVGESGRISSFKLSKNALISIGIVVGVSLFAAIASVLTYGILKVENARLRSSLEAVQTQLDQTNEAKEDLMAQLILREDLSSKQEGSKPSEKEKEPTKLTSKPLEPVLAKQTEDAAPTEPPAQNASQTVSPAVHKDFPMDMVVEDFRLHKDPATNRVRYAFILKHKNPRKKPVSGYTFVLLKPAQGDATSWRISPKRALQEGKPKNFKRGQLFSIARFKIVQGAIKDTESIDAWEEAVVLVYSASGELILEKVFAYQKHKPKPKTSPQTTETLQPEASISTQLPPHTETPDENDHPHP